MEVGVGQENFQIGRRVGLWGKALKGRLGSF